MKTLNNLKLARKLALAFFLLVLVSAAVGTVTWRNMAVLERTTDWTVHTYKVIGTAQDLVAGMVNQETGLRGFLIAGDEKFLAPYHGGYRQFSEKLAEAKRLTADNPTQQRRLADVERLAATWRNDVAEKEIAAAKTSIETARQQESSGAGKAAMDGLREKVAEFAAAEENLLATSGSIASAVEQQGAATKEISRNIEDASVGANMTSKSVTAVNSGMGEAGGATTQVLSASEELSRQAEKLSAHVQQFVNQVRAV